MKRFLRQLSAALLCCAMLLGSASALGLSQSQIDALDAKGVYIYGEHEFREGLMPVLVRNTWGYEIFDDPYSQPPETVWNYINENMEIVDLNRGRFSFMFPFYEGLAAVYSEKDGLGYINTSGEIVIPCQFTSYFSMGAIYSGYFHGGKATVFKLHEGVSDTKWYIGEIDKNGNVVTPFTLTDVDFAGRYIIADNGYMPDGAIEPYEGEVTYKIDVCTSSSSNLGGQYIYYDGAAYGLTINNGTKEPISEKTALVFYDNKTGDAVQVFFFDVELQAGTSHEYTFSSVYSGLSDGDFSYILVHFEDRAERDSFKNSINFENDPNGNYRVVKDGPQWLNKTFGLNF